MKDVIVNYIIENQGAKITDVVEAFFFDCEDVIGIIEELIRERRLVVVKYVIQGLNQKSFLLPKGTQVIR